MRRILVAYFSAGGTTRRAAEEIARAVDGDLWEIVPAQPYTAADLDWTDKKSRSTLEMNDPACRPAIAGPAVSVERYDTVEGCGMSFLVKEATPVYLGDAILYWHAMLWKAREVKA